MSLWLFCLLWSAILPSILAQTTIQPTTDQGSPKFTNYFPSLIPIRKQLIVSWSGFNTSVALFLKNETSDLLWGVADNLDRGTYEWYPATSRIGISWHMVIQDKQLYTVASENRFRIYDSGVYDVGVESSSTSKGSSALTATGTPAITTSITIGLISNTVVPLTSATSNTPSDAINLLSPTINESLTSSTTATAQQPPTLSSPPPQAIQTKSAGDVLSTGAKVGIGLGAALVFLLCCCLIAICFFRYGKRVSSESSPSTEATKVSSVETKTAQPLQETESRAELWAPDGIYLLPELDITPAAELEGRPMSGLVPTKKGSRAELDGRRIIIH
ncbi:hypothetical protein B0J14DRAFT_316517 [Halenospora varia]|nr:hypothetical protein B0J14DRAFT_316517 [Halenospora varia]